MCLWKCISSSPSETRNKGTQNHLFVYFLVVDRIVCRWVLSKTHTYMKIVATFYNFFNHMKQFVSQHFICTFAPLYFVKTTSLAFVFVCAMYTYIYMYVYACLCTYIKTVQYCQFLNIKTLISISHILLYFSTFSVYWATFSGPHACLNAGRK